MIRLLLASLIATLCLAAPASADRIKDLGGFQGIRSNQLTGYGVVVGLPGTGDRVRNAPFTEESLQAMLERMGVNVRDSSMKPANVAAVSVIATMPPFASNTIERELEVPWSSASRWVGFFGVMVVRRCS